MKKLLPKKLVTIEVEKSGSFLIFDIVFQKFL